MPRLTYGVQIATIFTLLPAADYDRGTVGDAVDLLGIEGPLALLVTSSAGRGDTPACTVLLEESDEPDAGASWSAVDGIGIDISDAAVVERILADSDKRKRYVRPVLEITGADLASVSAAIDTTVPGVAAVNAVQQFDLTGYTGGTFSFTVDSETSGEIAYNADAATVQAALEAMDLVDPGDIVCSGGPLPDSAVVLTFGGKFAGLPLDLPVINEDNLTGPGTATIDTTTPGVAPVDEVQTLGLVGAGAGTFTITLGAETTDPIQWDATAADVSDALEALSGVAAGDVSILGDRLPDGVLTLYFLNNLGGQDVGQITVDTSALLPAALGFRLSVLAFGVPKDTSV